MTRRAIPFCSALACAGVLLSACGSKLPDTAGFPSGGSIPFAVGSSSSASGFMPPPGPLWDDQTFPAAFFADNQRGKNSHLFHLPPQPTVSVERERQDEGVGSANFQLKVPVLELPGRGLNISLTLTYNSRLWSKSGGNITFDADGDWPAPGWSLGFGRLVGIQNTRQTMLIDADGTRHAFTGSLEGCCNFTGRTADGSLIDYTSTTTDDGRRITTATVKYPQGKIVEYGYFNANAIYPRQITDANGNFIVITYLNGQGPQIDTITDTLGRVIHFYYDGNNLLTAITAPGYNWGADREVVRLHYASNTIDFRFSQSLTPIAPVPTRWMIDGIYLPATHTGYDFTPTGSFSSYGMLARVAEQRNMQFSAPSVHDQGTLASGSDTRVRTYNYPLQAIDGLNDAPTFTRMTEVWAGSDDAVVPTLYSVDESSNRTVTVTYPDNSQHIVSSYHGTEMDGLAYLEETHAADGGLLERVSRAWEVAPNDGYNSPRVTGLSRTDERNQTLRTEYSYGPYNQIAEIREYDYDGSLLRRTASAYEPAQGYIDQHIYNLRTAVELYERDGGTPASRTEYTYDNQTLADAPGVTQHIDRGSYRGNLTQAKVYADAATRGGGITETRKYDVAGNLVTVIPQCCGQTSTAYAASNHAAYPTQWVRGSATDPTQQVTTNAGYDFNTGLVTSLTDANGRPTSMGYDPASLRPLTVGHSTGAVETYQFDDSAITVHETTQLTDGGITHESLTTLNGLKLVRRTETRAADGPWATVAKDLVEKKYDRMQRPWQQSRPYRTGETAQFTVETRDGLGRVIQTLAPDNSRIQSFYNEANRPVGASSIAGQTVRVRDAWGKEKWTRHDARNRLAEVVEPNPTGDGSLFSPQYQAGNLPTAYAYNVLNKLVRVDQPPQWRQFGYDSLGRLTHQKLAERSATLDDSGNYGGLSWSDFFVYDVRSNLITSVDARGVKTIYTYGNDPLNRLQGVLYDRGNVGDPNPIVDSPTVSYQYMTAGDLTRVRLVTASGVDTEEYRYDDAEGRLTKKTVTLVGRAAFPLSINYNYDNVNRVAETFYPAEYGMPDAPRKRIAVDFDADNHPKKLYSDENTYASQILYDASNQPTFMRIGEPGELQIYENYTHDPIRGFLTDQWVQRANATLLDLHYNYLRDGSTEGRTGRLTQIVNNLNTQRTQSYQYDAVQRLVGASTPRWSQSYAYDRYGNRTSVTASGEIPDGLINVHYDPQSNRVTDGVTYDSAGNQIQVFREDGTWQRYQYDTAGRLAKVLTSAGVTIERYIYGAGNHRLVVQQGDSSNQRTYYVWSGDQIVTEYRESDNLPDTPTWTKSYIYLGSRLLSTLTPGQIEKVNYHHPDNRGTRLVTSLNTVDSFEQVTFPFGVPLDSESTGATNRRFTSYDRSLTSRIDYAANRYYDYLQGRFTQTDPLGIAAVTLRNPQTLNLYQYGSNDPVNRVDPFGLQDDDLFDPPRTYDTGNMRLRAEELRGNIYWAVGMAEYVLHNLVFYRETVSDYGFEAFGVRLGVKSSLGDFIEDQYFGHQHMLLFTEYTDWILDKTIRDLQQFDDFMQKLGEVLYDSWKAAETRGSEHPCPPGHICDVRPYCQPPNVCNPEDSPGEGSAGEPTGSQGEDPAPDDEGEPSDASGP